jgi:hypothetical protein
VKKKTKARIKAQPKPATVTVTLSSNDFGQMMDGLRERQTAWRITAEHWRGEEDHAEAMEYGIQECSGEDEAQKIADHYQKLIADLEGQQKWRGDFDLLENVAAISAELWGGDTKRNFYVRFGAELSGFPGVWAYSVQAARAFTKAEERFAKEIGRKPEHSYEYLDAILHFAEWLATAETLPTTAELEAKAWGALLAARN